MLICNGVFVKDFSPPLHPNKEKQSAYLPPEKKKNT